MLPPFFDPSPGFPEARAMIAALRSALLAARPGKVVCLSTVGAQVKRQNLLTQLSILEQELGDLPIPVTFLRPAWFMENFAWDIKAARQGLVPSFLQPLDKAIPMVARAGGGRAAATNLSARRVVELEGPRLRADRCGEQLCSDPRPSCARGGRAARELGKPVQIAGMKPGAPHADARWLQWRLDQLRGSGRLAPSRAKSS